MDIKEFVKGRRAYVISGDIYDSHCTNTEIKEVVVLKVGHSIVGVQSRRWVSEFVDIGEQYLLELVDYGTPKKLFLSFEAASQYLEKKALLQWITLNVNRHHEQKYSLEQLRAVKEILANGRENTESE